MPVGQSTSHGPGRHQRADQGRTLGDVRSLPRRFGPQDPEPPVPVGESATPFQNQGNLFIAGDVVAAHARLNGRQGIDFGGAGHMM